ncbi:hypothetical protein SAMN05216386_0883 [Nitrosospira briensis]|uniref:Uncharacterized protein n=1 Tax=Nitrosospira briensis TaxID=35799 RepID=A0A1I4YTQ5_9PROT|nr:hypothetical protein SAMN05216386_0883 [Nitrosospira briensis]SFN76626.1 hypothetical protein SAMN05216332_101537 [Nitrosospira briensis]
MLNFQVRLRYVALTPTLGIDLVVIPCGGARGEHDAENIA